ncbi:unnamed protein product [Rhodiola kirilowii]
MVWCEPAASMVNQISCDIIPGNSSIQQLTSDTVIEVSMKLPSTFFAIPVKTIESAGTKVLEQVMKLMLPRFMAQLVKDYTAWALGQLKGTSWNRKDLSRTDIPQAFPIITRKRIEICYYIPSHVAYKLS